MKNLTANELKIDPENYETVNRWLRRGDGIAAYENHDFGSPEMGHRKFCSYGSPAAQFEGDPPSKLPDMGGAINWRYILVGVYRGPELGEVNDLDEARAKIAQLRRLNDQLEARMNRLDRLLDRAQKMLGQKIEEDSDVTN